jgi:sulfate permease, SulP family
VVLDLETAAFIDSQGAEQLAQIHEFVEAQSASLRLARVKPQVLAVLERDGVIGQIGGDHVHGNIDRAVEAQLADNRWTGEAMPRAE